MSKLLPFGLLLALCMTPAATGAQHRGFDLSQLDLSQIDLSRIDPAAIMASANDTLMRAPDGSIDELFQALHTASRTPRDADTLCGLFDPQADRSAQALMAAAQNLGPDSRQRFSTALINIAATGLQNPRQAYDARAAKQTLKSAGTTAMLLHDGFSAGLSADGNDAAGRQARCRSFGWLLDALKELPVEQRAAAMRLLLNEGLARLAPG